MRKHFAVVTLLLLSAASAFAQQDRTAEVPKGTFRIFGFGSNLGFSESNSTGTNFHGGYGLGFEYQVSARWSTELSLAREATPFYGFASLGPDGVLQPQRIRVTSYPVDIVGQYHFFTDTAWKPFVGIGLRYVNVDKDGYPYPVEDSRFSPQISAGFYYNFTPHFGLRLDAKRLLRNDSAFYDDTHKVSLGLGWKF